MMNKLNCDGGREMESAITSRIDLLKYVKDSKICQIRLDTLAKIIALNLYIGESNSKWAVFMSIKNVCI